MNVGENIRLRRIKEGIKQQDLAEQVSITASMLSQIERGKKPLSPQTQSCIAKALHCSERDLINMECKIELAESR